jgi:hypothetical protein
MTTVKRIDGIFNVYNRQCLHCNTTNSLTWLLLFKFADKMTYKDCMESIAEVLHMYTDINQYLCCRDIKEENKYVANDEL